MHITTAPWIRLQITILKAQSAKNGSQTFGPQTFIPTVYIYIYMLNHLSRKSGTPEIRAHSVFYTQYKKRLS